MIIVFIENVHWNVHVHVHWKLTLKNHDISLIKKFSKREIDISERFLNENKLTKKETDAYTYTVKESENTLRERLHTRKLFYIDYLIRHSVSCYALISYFYAYLGQRIYNASIYIIYFRKQIWFFIHFRPRIGSLQNF